MNRKVVLIGVASIGLVLGITTLALLIRENSGAKVSVSFLKAEPSHGEFPTYIEGERFDFAARNPGSKPVSVYVLAMEDEHGDWVSSQPRNLGQVQARQTTRLYLYLPLGLHPRSVRMRVYEEASLGQKTEYALSLLIDKAAGRQPRKQVWFDKMQVPTYDLVVRSGNEAEPDGAAKRGQPVCPETDSTSSAAGSRR